jgi:hypothetical protein
MKKYLIELQDEGQDLCELTCLVSGDFLQIVGISVACCNAIRELYIDKWIYREELSPGQHFNIIDPKQSYTGFECIYPFKSIREEDLCILELTVTKQWYEMISSGIKKEEYREIKQYWLNRLFEPLAKKYRRLPDFAIGPSLNSTKYSTIPAYTKARHFDAIRFTNGYGGNRPSFLIEYKGVKVGTGRKEWGTPDERVFILELGRMLERKKS